MQIVSMVTFLQKVTLTRSKHESGENFYQLSLILDTFIWEGSKLLKVTLGEIIYAENKLFMIIIQNNLNNYLSYFQMHTLLPFLQLQWLP